MTKQQTFFNQVYATAKSLGASDTLAAIAAAQSAIETGWGEHVKGNSYFGVKANNSWTGNRTRFITSEYENGKNVKQKLSFRAYEGLEQSTRDYLQVIKNAFPKAYSALTLKEATDGLGKGVHGRYATDLKYEQKVLSIANNYLKTARKTSNGSKPKLQRGDSGLFVNELLTILEKWKYYSGPQDSVFGGGAEAAVRHFQQEAKIQVDGIVGKVTWAKLAEWNRFATEITTHAKGAGVFLVNQSAIRNQSVTSYLMDTLEDGMFYCFGQGCRAEIYSGGQPSLGTSDRRTGSVRHDKGRAMDVHLFLPNGRQIIGKELAKLAQWWLATGSGSVGLEMSGGGIHLDEWKTPPKGGALSWVYKASNNKPYLSDIKSALANGKSGILPEKHKTKDVVIKDGVLDINASSDEKLELLAEMIVQKLRQSDEIFTQKEKVMENTNKNPLMSRGVVGSVVSLFATILFAVTQIEISADLQVQFVEVLVVLLGGGGSITSLIGRLFAKERIM